MDASSRKTNQNYVSAIIDVGLDEPTLRRYEGSTLFLMVSDGEIVNHDRSNLSSISSHGGQCLEHFELGACRPADVFILLKHDNSGRCNVNDLISAIQWCEINRITLTSLSMGTNQYSDATKIADALLRMKRSYWDTCFIAGASNERLISYPACLPTCIGVNLDTSQTVNQKAFAYIKNPYDGTDIMLNPHANGDRIIGNTSMATAYFAGLVTKAIVEAKADPGDMDKWLSSYINAITPRDLYTSTLASIVGTYEEDVLVVAVEGMSSCQNSRRYCRKLQGLFLEAGYHCLMIYPNYCAEVFTDIANFEFEHPNDTGCSYQEYVALTIQLCQPNLILVDYGYYTGEIDALIYIKDSNSSKGINITQVTMSRDTHTPARAYNMIVESF